MAKKHLAAVSLLIVLIFGLTACVCRSSDTAISMPVYDKPASATANTRTMQDETATKSSSEKSSEATTESAQSEDASALIFPNPCSEQFDLSERDAVLFDAAVAARNRTPNADICIPEIGVYGTYEEAEKTVIVCHVCYHFYYGCDGTEHYTDSGAMQAPALCRHRQKQCWKYLMICCIVCPLNWCRMVLEPTCGQKSSVGL